MLKAVKKTRASQDVVRQIVTLIEKGKLKKMEQLPPEREMAETFQVSRTTVREAIRSLESMQLVETKQGNGTYITVSVAEMSVKPLTTGLFTEKDDLADIFHIRKIIEPSIAQLAAEFATDEDIDEIDNLLKKQEEEVRIGRNPIGLDTNFHISLARVARNRVLGRLLHALVELLGNIHENQFQNSLRLKKSLSGHKEIFEAIRKGDGLESKKAMRQHLNEIEEILFNVKKGGGKCNQQPSKD